MMRTWGWVLCAVMASWGCGDDGDDGSGGGATSTGGTTSMGGSGGTSMGGNGGSGAQGGSGGQGGGAGGGGGMMMVDARAQCGLPSPVIGACDDEATINQCHEYYDVLSQQDIMDSCPGSFLAECAPLDTDNTALLGICHNAVDANWFYTSQTDPALQQAELDGAQSGCTGKSGGYTWCPILVP